MLLFRTTQYHYKQIDADTVAEKIRTDEVALAKRGTWILFPVGFRHSPFSHGDGCIMIVREGAAGPGFFEFRHLYRENSAFSKTLDL